MRKLAGHIRKAWNRGKPPAPRDLGHINMELLGEVELGEKLIVQLNGIFIEAYRVTTCVARTENDSVRALLIDNAGIACAAVRSASAGVVRLALQ